MAATIYEVTNMTSVKHIVMTASAQMPASCWGTYRRVAVVSLEDGFNGVPKMISPRARGINRVVRTWESLNVGSTDRCAYRVALAEAAEMADQLNV